MKALDVFAHWDGVRKGLYAALDKLTDAQLDFSPREGLWSIREVAFHISGGAEDWFDYFLQGLWPPADGRPGPDDYPTVAALKAMLEERYARTKAWIETLDEESLDRQCALPWGAKCSVGYALWHILEHEIHHRGEIYLMLGMLGIEAPDV